jgi:hypothetical protein
MSLEASLQPMRDQQCVSFPKASFGAPACDLVADFLQPMPSIFPCNESPATNHVLFDCLRLYGRSWVLPHDDTVELHAQ